VPLAVTLKVAVCPAVTVWFAGGVVIVGGVLTVNVAGVLVTVPPALVTVTVKIEPLSPLTAAGVVYVLEVAPPMATPPLYHW
jgi:hypothetical protein